jgi:hypothetical protein
MPESLSDRYAELLRGSYDCVDPIVLNACSRMGHGAGGFRVWWRTLTGSEETLDNTHLMRMAGRFSRRLHGYAKAAGISLVHCQAGERKHELAEEHLAKTQITQGLFGYQTIVQLRLSRITRKIKKADFQASLPKKASPSAKYFWSARRGPVKKTPKIRVSTHQFPPIL